MLVNFQICSIHYRVFQTVYTFPSFFRHFGRQVFMELYLYIYAFKSFYVFNTHSF